MVATDWTPVIQTAIGALAAIGGGFVGAWVQGRAQQRMEQDRRRERAAELLAGVGDFLARVNPGGLRLQVMTDDPGVRLNDPAATMAGLWTEQGELRTKLLVLAAGHPKLKVRTQARLLELQLADCMEGADELIRRVTSRPPGSHRYAGYSVDQLEELADESHRNARRGLRDLLEAI